MLILLAAAGAALVVYIPAALYVSIKDSSSRFDHAGGEVAYVTIQLACWIGGYHTALCFCLDAELCSIHGAEADDSRRCQQYHPLHRVRDEVLRRVVLLRDRPIPVYLGTARRMLGTLHHERICLRAGHHHCGLARDGHIQGKPHAGPETEQGVPRSDAPAARRQG